MAFSENFFVSFAVCTVIVHQLFSKVNNSSENFFQKGTQNENFFHLHKKTFPISSNLTKVLLPT